MSPTIHDAVTAVLLHGDHLYLVQRHPALQAFPGYHAFPGGKVDPEDHEHALDHPLFEGQAPHLVRALLRELSEELDFNLLHAAQKGQIESLQCMDEITAPPWVPKRFRTWFYKIVLTERPVFELDTGESISADWRRIAEWQQHFSDGRLLLAPPTRLVLDALHEDLSTSRLPPFPAHMRPQDSIGWIEPVGGLRMLLVRSNTLPPASHTNAFWLGDKGSPKVLIDPSPANEDELRKIFAYLEQYGVDQIFLTHHHPDHHEFSTEIARRHQVPMLMSADTHARIRNKRGETHFAGIAVRELDEGDVLTQWQGEPVQVLAVPGHDEGQLAPMPESRTWCIVGDLIQGVGTVVVGGDEGDMSKYFASLQRIIDLDPAVIIPSHGMAMGTTHFLRQALEHRKMREAQILSGHQAGLSEQQILERVYAGVDPRLAPLALVNIRSHLQKLREEKRLP